MSAGGNCPDHISALVSLGVLIVRLCINIHEKSFGHNSIARWFKCITHGENAISTKMVGLFIGHFLFIFVYVYAALLMNVIGRAYLFKVGRSRTCFHITCVQS